LRTGAGLSYTDGGDFVTLNVADIGAAVYSDTNISVATGGTGTKLTFNQERWDTDTCHDNVTNNTRLTCNTAGKYIITGCAAFANNATGYRWLYILLNNTTNIGEQGFLNATAAYYCRVGCSAIYNLVATDYIELVAFQDSGGALNVLSLGNYSPEFRMQRIA